jgi:ubiquinone/menaquinone biosynthesis C-methylase UbiE
MIRDDHKQWVSQVFDRAAPEYGKKSSSFFCYFGRRLVEQAEVKPHHRVLDVATGKGAVLFPLTEIIDSEGKLVGIDISQQMLDETSKELRKKEISSVELIHMDAENLAFPDHDFDFVFCGFALFFFPSVQKALAEFKRVLKPGGRLLLSIWGDDSTLDACIHTEINKLIHTTSLAATPIWDGSELQRVLEQAGFLHVQICKEEKIFTHETPEEWFQSLWHHGTRSKLEQLSPLQLAELRKNVLSKAAEYTKSHGLEETLQVFYGIAQK